MLNPIDGRGATTMGRPVGSGVAATAAWRFHDASSACVARFAGRRL